MSEEKVFVIGYQKRFVPKILDGTKTFTIRKIRKDGRVPEVGQTLRKYTGMRTANCKRIFPPGMVEPVCTGVWPVEIRKVNDSLWYIQSEFFKDVMDELTIETYRKNPRNQKENDFAETLATMDGWDSPGEMFDFFGKSGLPFDGNLIYWGEL